MTTTDAAQAGHRIVLRVLSDGEYVVNHSLITADGGCPPANVSSNE